MWLMWEKIIKEETWLPRAKESNFLLRSLAYRGINFLCFLFCLDQNELMIFFSSLTRSWSWAWQCLLLLVRSKQFMIVCLIFPFCSCRTRCWIILNAAAVANSAWWPSLKRRRTTKIRRLTVAWDCRVPSLLIHCVFCHISVVTPLPVLGLFPHMSSPSVSPASASSCRSSWSFSCGRVAYSSLLSHRPPVPCKTFLSRNRKYSLKNSPDPVQIFRDISEGA